MTDLILTKDDVTKKLATAMRMSTVVEAIGWPGGPDVFNKLPTVIYSRDGYEVRLSKPGKEAAPEYDGVNYKDGHKGNNPNDMRPEIVINGVLKERNASFTDIFEELQKMHLRSVEGIRIMAILLARSAYLADHDEVKPGIYRYSPPADLLADLQRLIPTAYDVPIDVFLYYLEALALNEDVKYHTLGYDIGDGTGRKNNLLTCVHIIAVMLGEISIATFAGSFARPPRGISAISLKNARRIFPELGPET